MLHIYDSSIYLTILNSCLIPLCYSHSKWKRRSLWKLFASCDCLPSHLPRFPTKKDRNQDGRKPFWCAARLNRCFLLRSITSVRNRSSCLVHFPIPYIVHKPTRSLNRASCMLVIKECYAYFLCSDITNIVAAR